MNYKHAFNKRERLLWLPILFLFLVIPNIIYYKLYNSRLYQYAWGSTEKTNTDFYLYYKHLGFLILTIWILCCLFALAYIQRKEKTFIAFWKEAGWQWLLPLAYIFFALLSSIISKNRFSAFTGSDGQFESWFALAGYVVLLYYLQLLIRDERSIKYITVCLGLMALFQAFLGVLQFTGNDPFMMEWFQRLVTPEGYLEACGPITNNFEKNRVSLFSYNPNYAGVFLAMLSALIFAFVITERNLKRILLETALLALLVVSLIGTGSKAGLLVLIGIVLLLSAILLIRKLKYKSIFLFGILLLGMILCRNMIVQLPMAEKVVQALTIEKKERNPLTQLTTEKEGVFVSYRGIDFMVSLEEKDNSFSMNVKSMDGTSIPLSASMDKTYYYLNHEMLTDVTLDPGYINNSIPAFTIDLNGHKWMFVKLAEDASPYYYLNHFLLLETLAPIERLGFAGYEEIATNRGLIWSMTLPLLKDRILFGCGANNFVHAYPQNNYKDMLYYFGDIEVTTRPHSMYLQITVETGVLSLISLLIFWSWYLVQSIRLYWRGRFTDNMQRIGFACFLAVFVYLICGLTNDSMITVAPIFWGILGIGLAANRINKAKLSKILYT